MLRYLAMAILLLSPALFAAPASAYEFSPIVAQFNSKGAAATRTFTLRNTQQEPVAIQIEVFQRSADATGEETRVPEFDDFIVTPPQVVLAPGQSQAIRVQWIGDANPAAELSYRIVTTQLPIKYASEQISGDVQATLQLGYKYEAAVYVAPQNVKPSASITAAAAATDAAGNRVMRLTIKSTGTRRAILETPEITVTPASGGQSVVLKGEAVSAIQMKNIITGTQRVLDIPWPSNVPYGPVTASLKTTYYTK